MRSPGSDELLALWERGLGETSVARGLALLELVHPDMDADTAADLSIGVRDGLLLDLRELLFGRTITGLVECPACGDTLETEMATGQLRAAPARAPLEISRGDYALSLRLLNSRDQIAAERATPEERWRLLLDRCVASASRSGEPTAVTQLPAEVIAAVEDRIAELDPQADVQLALSCPACGHQWQAAFDILPFLWAELSEWAARTLRDVHRLASAYGWSERDILALSPIRRRHYLGMLEAWPAS
ncbi:hypothetical protein KXR53_23500 [Inquilinus limosus]|uniref:T4 family baseplate hub assembly chaperone n=1 Tax=Inquilinus limosus TaxID=171674 RepID=UPI003F144FEE